MTRTVLLRLHLRVEETRTEKENAREAWLLVPGDDETANDAAFERYQNASAAYLASPEALATAVSVIVSQDDVQHSPESRP